MQPPRSGAVPIARATLDSVHWERIELRDAVVRLNQVADSVVYLDRRVDLTRRVSLSLRDATIDEMVRQMATGNSLGACRLGRLLYIGPTHAAERLVTLAASRRQEAAQLSAEVRRTLAERRRVAWPRLSEPRGLVVQLAEDHGWRVSRAERIPHDLWDAGRLPALPLADQLTVLLVGFDLTYRLRPERQSLEIVPVDWGQIEPAQRAVAAERRAPAPRPSAKRVYTLRVEAQPVGAVLAHFERQLGWQIDVDEAAIRAAGRSLDQRVSFTVENADDDELLRALLEPAGLTFARDGNRVAITPR